jgi:hypothetical protein
LAADRVALVALVKVAPVKAGLVKVVPAGATVVLDKVVPAGANLRNNGNST